VKNATALVAVGTASLASSAAALTAPAGVPAPAATPRPSMPDQSRTPLALSGMPPAALEAAPPAPPPPTADPRATSFGFGVPLRARVGSAADLRASAASGRVPLRPRAPVARVLVSNDPTAPPWTQLPVNIVRKAADAAQKNRYPARPCGCRGECTHGAGACR
jgi:hypothetical protein